MNHAFDEDAASRPISRALIRRMLNRLGSRRKLYTLVCLFGLIIAFLEMIPPKLVGSVITELSEGTSASRAIGTAGILWAGITVVTQLLHGFQISLANRSGEYVLARLRLDCFVHLQRLSMSYFDRTQMGSILARTNTDIEALRNILTWGINTLVANITILVLAAAMIFHTDYHLFLSIAWLIPILFVLSYFYSRRVGSAWQKVRFYSTQVSRNQAESIQGVRVIAAFNRQQRNLDRYNEMQEENTFTNVAASRVSGLFQPWLHLIRFLGQAILLLYGGYAVAKGRLGTGDLVAASLYWEWFMLPAGALGVFMNDLMSAMASAERVFAFLEAGIAIQDMSGARPLPRLTGSIRFEAVSFAYHPNNPVLQGIDFEIPAGATVALVGGTGSGKSTIISLLARFYLPQAGRILLDDFDLRSVQDRCLRKQVALVLQNNYLFSGTVMDNLRYGKSHLTESVIFSAARELGCHKRFQHLKAGYDTPVGERGAALSLGERQLVCFTRALLSDPRILLLDEATSAMDAVTEQQLQNALRTLARNRTTIIVAHRLSTIVNADKILVLEQGRIVEQGKHRELIALSGRYAEFFHHWQTPPQSPRAS